MRNGFGRAGLRDNLGFHEGERIRPSPMGRR